jgi:chemotaxis protein CheD
MIDDGELNEYFISPGFVCVPKEPTLLKAVVASGIVVTAYDHRLNIGGMCYYTHPRRQKKQSSPRFAAPAILSFIKIFEDSGCNNEDIEFSIYGGAVNKNANDFVVGLSEDNVIVGKEILAKKGVRLLVADCGGRMARKVIFNSHNGELMVARVQSVRDNDWYPSLTSTGKERR